MHDENKADLTPPPVSVDDNAYNHNKKNKKQKKMKRNTKTKDESNHHRKPEELTDSEDDDQDDPNELQARFTADGLVYVDKDGNVVKRKEETSDSDSDLESESGDEKDGDKIGLQSKGGGDHHPLLAKGTRVQGNYHAAEQFDSQDAWYDGVISRVHEQPDGSVKYDVDYDDGDFEENMLPEYVRPIEKTKEEKKILEEKTEKELEIQFKRNKARDKARYVLLLFLAFLGVFLGSPFLCRTLFCCCCQHFFSVQVFSGIIFQGVLL